ncbi:enoyl-CoA hydratase/isomerase family protein [Streptomyces sp. RS2]|uniref:enoyl-CoA hydratase/isomerase family protein n=1 Tax=Streptomyces sp. RS2 TaxID=1451205 RepID=UPI0021F88901|nr:enoyl-CoA hydratase/isomerase family protein [Streptomyces sp. RS2]MCW1100247.1 enoyl-CoA hydratase/isomerase family protein [Streptomyces sp. RS2]
MSSSLITVESRDKVSIIHINRPHVHNALSAELLAQLGTAIGDLNTDGTTRAVVITGTGTKAFSAGADLEALSAMDVHDAHLFLQAGQEALRRIEQSDIPVIAAVNGVALGGGFELALACSFALLSTSASLALPEAGLGLMPGFGGTQRLVRTVGTAVARHLMLTGRRVDAERAFQLGLSVLPPVPPEELLPAALTVAEEIAKCGPQACRSILRAVEHAQDAPLEAGLAYETTLAALAVGGPESAEGIGAFLGRRTPDFDQVSATHQSHVRREPA